MCIEEHVITQNWTFRETMTTAGIDVLWGQRIKLIQVASDSELHENQWNDLFF